jgi:asparagine synthase (glutamine-hydrolysing)
MSGLVVVWHLDGRPADPALVTTMAATIAHRGRDHFGIWSDGSACLACHLSRTTPESVTECQPSIDSDGDVLLFDGRIDNREEIRASLTTPVSSDCPDSSLVLAAWREWGQDLLSKLQGDFALALFDVRAQRLVLARDPIGCRPLYYWSDGRTMIAASEIKAILAHADVRAAPNADLLADFFLLDRLPYDDDGQTFFEAIHAVRPGHWRRVAPHHTTSGQFWDFDPLARIRLPSYSAYSDRLRELLIHAVKRRLRSRSPIAVAVSGGLDSSIVLCIADDLCRSGDAHVPLLPLSYTPRDESQREENHFIDLLESARQLRVRRIAIGEPCNPEQLEHAAWHSESARFDDARCAERPMLAAAHALDARVLLTGLWSDQFLFVTGYLTDLFRTLAWRQVKTHLQEYPRWFVDADPAYFRARFRRDLLLALTPNVVRAWLRPFRTAMSSPRTLPFISRTWAARVRRRRPRFGRPRFGSDHARNIYQAVRAQSHRLEFEADDKSVASYALEAVSPFLDRDVIAFLMSIPGDVQTRGGVPRALLRDAMRGIVPDAILRRRWRDDEAAAPERARKRRHTYLDRGITLQSCAALGFASDAREIGPDALEFLGLEIWSRVFFSGKLSAPRPESKSL